MTHGRTPRRPRPIATNPITLAMNQATRLTVFERERIMVPLRAAVAALRQGVATEYQWMMAVTAVNVGDAIERQGVVRGLAGHLRDIDRALKGICDRAMETGEWRAPALHLEERDLVDLIVDLHGHQLKSLSFGEFNQARDKAVQQTYTDGGRVVPVSQQMELA
jgi:hypothetical protein